MSKPKKIIIRAAARKRRAANRAAKKTADAIADEIINDLRRELLEAMAKHERIQQGELQKFSFETPVDVFWKLDWEIARLNHATPDDIIDMKCFAFNAAVTAWQLTDWIFEDMSDEQRRQFKISKLVDLQNLVRQQCRALHLCRQIATASKHRLVKGYYDDSVSTRVDVDGTGWGLVIIDGDKSHPAIDVFEEARLYWYKFLCELGLIL